MRTSSLLKDLFQGLRGRSNWARTAAAVGAIALPSHIAMAQAGPDRPELFRDVLERLAGEGELKLTNVGDFYYAS